MPVEYQHMHIILFENFTLDEISVDHHLTRLSERLNCVTSLRISGTGLKVGEMIDSTLKQITTTKLAYGAFITWAPWYAFLSIAVHDSALTNWLPIVCFNYSPGCIKYIM